jgi:hypothetical protein
MIGWNLVTASKHCAARIVNVASHLQVRHNRTTPRAAVVPLNSRPSIITRAMVSRKAIAFEREGGSTD